MATYLDPYAEVAVLDDGVSDSIAGVTLEAAVLDDSIEGGSATTTTYAEAAVLDDAIADSSTSVLDESAVLNDAALSFNTATNTLSESAVLNDWLGFEATDAIAETAVLDDSPGASVITSAIDEAAVLDDAIASTQSLFNSAGEVALLDDLATGQITSVIAESAVLEDNVEGSSSLAIDRVAETAVLNDTLAGYSQYFDELAESAVLDDALGSRLTNSIDAIAELAEIHGQLFDPATGTAWAAPTDSFAMSRYTNYPFNSMAVVDGVLVGATDEGLFRLDAADDAGDDIDATLEGDLTDQINGKTGPTSDPRLRRPNIAWLGYSSSGSVLLTVAITQDGAEVSRRYPLAARAAGVPVAGRVKLGRGLRSRYFRFGLENISGSDMSIDNVQVSFDMLQRRA